MSLVKAGVDLALLFGGAIIIKWLSNDYTPFQPVNVAMSIALLALFRAHAKKG